MAMSSRHSIAGRRNICQLFDEFAHSSHAARLVAGPAQFAIALSSFIEGGDRTDFVLQRAAMHAACFPERCRPGASVPHAGDTLRIVQSAVDLLEFPIFGKRDGRGDAQCE